MLFPFDVPASLLFEDIVIDHMHTPSGCALRLRHMPTGTKVFRDAPIANEQQALREMAIELAEVVEALGDVGRPNA